MSISNLNKQPYPYIIKNRSNFFVEYTLLPGSWDQINLTLTNTGFPIKLLAPASGAL
jgi:hypothetical protein